MDRKIKILLVEDNAADVHIIEEMLAEESEHLFCYEHVYLLEDALNKIQESQFDVVMLDLDLPDTSGLEAINKMMESDSDIPIVVTSGTSDKAVVMETMQKGAHDYLVKGDFDAPELFRVLQLATQLATQDDELSDQFIRSAHNDSLTGLANRALFYDCLTKSLNDSQQSNGATVLLLINLDRFNQINDRLGNSTGDKVLQEVARRLTDCCPDKGTVARIGGDDFALVIDDVRNIKESVKVAETVVARLSKTIAMEDQDVRLSASLGIAFYPMCSNISDLMYSAEIALFRAKSAGGNRYKIFTDDLSHEAAWKYGLETDLEYAIEKEEFVIHYQPLLSLHTGQVTGVEALLRWQHPKAGLLFPNTFIEQLETSRGGWDISEWIMMLTCHHLKSWQTNGFTGLKMDINFSAYQLRDPNLVARVERVLKKTGIAAQDIEIELTERQPLSEDDIVGIRNIKALVEMGVSFALDDYGTGHSTDSYLRRFPSYTISTIKIDRSYIKHITTNPTYASCVKRDIDFAHDLGMQVIAEGVETLEQLDYVKALGADMVQGYLVSKAIAAPLVADGIYQGKFDLENVYGRHQQKIAV